jgi:N-acetyl-anhydromuramyl-L-alanine amidase AmpD
MFRKQIDLTDELIQHDTKRYSTRSLDDISKIVVHQTDSLDKGKEHPFRTAEYHVNTKGWPAIAYHYFITKDGNVYQTNKLNKVSYHAGNNNPESVGVTITGKHRYISGTKNWKIISKPMYRSLVMKLAKLKRQFKHAEIVSHDSLSDSRSDPNLDMDELRKDVTIYQIARYIIIVLFIAIIMFYVWKMAQ